jgi:hypothetical protein
MNDTCEICNGGEHDLGDHPYLPKIKESHNPLDIVFGHEVNELNPNPKDIDEGGDGSGRNPEGGGDVGGSQAGPLMSFETVDPVKIIESVSKSVMDAKLNCQCKTKTG